MDRETLLVCRDVSLGYEHRAIVENLNFSVAAGDYLCIVSIQFYCIVVLECSLYDINSFFPPSLSL